MYDCIYQITLFLLMLFAFFSHLHPLSFIIFLMHEFHFVMYFPFGYGRQQALVLLATNRSYCVCVCVCGVPQIILVTLGTMCVHSILTIKYVLSNGKTRGRANEKTCGSTVYGWRYDWTYDAKIKLMNGMPLIKKYMLYKFIIRFGLGWFT